jgi:hypothetical protein
MELWKLDGCLIKVCLTSMMEVKSHRAIEISWTSNGRPSDFHHGDRPPMELWMFHGLLMDVHLTSTMEIDVPWSYGRAMDIHWRSISMWDVYGEISNYLWKLEMSQHSFVIYR